MKRESLLVSLCIAIVLSVQGLALGTTVYTSFSDVYEFNNPWASSDWTEMNISDGFWDNSVSGYLDYEDSHESEFALQKMNDADPVGAEDDWTIEISVRVDDQGTQLGTASQAYAGLMVAIMNSDYELTEMVVQSSAIQLRTDSGWVTVDSSDNSDTYHQIRLTRNAAGEVKLWRDGLSTGPAQTVDDNDPGYIIANFVLFGDFAYAGGAGNADGLDVSLDYLAFDIGNAYDIPEPATMLMMAIASVSCFLRRRRC